MLEWNKVTWYSKLLAIIFFIGVLPAWTFYIGTQYEEAKSTFYPQPTATLSSEDSNSHTSDATPKLDACADQSTLGMSACAEEDFNDQNAKLTALYTKINAAFDKDVAAKDTYSPAYAILKDSVVQGEKSWATYRDKICVAETGIDVFTSDDLSIGGTISQVLYPACEAQLTQDEIGTLTDVYENWNDPAN